jgi:uncharacterized membrane protein
MEEIGPVDYLIVSFPGSRFNGKIAPGIADLIEAGTIRVIDAVFVSRATDGSVAAMELTELDPDVRAGLQAAGIDSGGLFNDEDIIAAGEDLEPGSSGLLLVWENLWAKKVAQAMRDSHGQMLAFGRIPHEVVQAAREWALENSEGVVA